MTTKLTEFLRVGSDTIDTVTVKVYLMPADNLSDGTTNERVDIEEVSAKVDKAGSVPEAVLV